MSLSIYAHSPAQFIRGLQNLSSILKKAEQFLHEKQLAESTLLEARLAPDMFPLLRQVQITSDTAKGAVARLSGQEVPAMPDNEASFAELHQRIEKTIAYLQRFQAGDFADADGRTIKLQSKSREFSFTAEGYLLTFAIPNFYFHLTAAYAILRHQGVELGKMDYLGQV
ncbi:MULTISPECIES: DUF1993 family protein [unclassified Serratia (in: enterobacteria)]|uniref:DUF1993 domain-containing protein n=1 Tax=unclassified Serratia (in: enterobacteria) TaxID=2647522 RepID=UPI0005071405|nr:MULTISPECIES: DUF1993 domain-containing protein [unclassified Serratia (in: enterobacteria)]KFK96830.1 hypothetical protein JV45_03660 [Serratia sp. Ag2]KFK97373.1 hypothetical protein IV04_16030 [Serratia sp. Ag1]